MPTHCLRPSLRHYALVAGLLAAVLTTGCATTVVPAAPAESSAHIATEPAPGFVPVARYGRYTLVELVPEPAQRDLLQQVIEISIPPTLDVNVGDAMRHVLRHSGYQLCDAANATMLYALPLPAAHRRLGPLMLRDVLLTLAGSGWQLSVDDLNRQVCFSHHSTSAVPPHNSAAVVVPAVATQVRVSGTEGRLDKTTWQTTPTVLPPQPAAMSTLPKRPFRVLGAELRGSERFLSVIPITTGSLAATRLLREGDAFGDWRLHSIDTHVAVFGVNGLRVRVAVP
ncbi:MAG: hypothetical protein CMH65_00865 [Nevskiales bacterium]|nr:hypothetical protein [Nevskiales bacterium]